MFFANSPSKAIFSLDVCCGKNKGRVHFFKLKFNVVSFTGLFAHRSIRTLSRKKICRTIYYDAIITRISTYCDYHKSLTNLTLLFYVIRHVYDTDEL